MHECASSDALESADGLQPWAGPASFLKKGSGALSSPFVRDEAINAIDPVRDEAALSETKRMAQRDDLPSPALLPPE